MKKYILSLICCFMTVIFIGCNSENDDAFSIDQTTQLAFSQGLEVAESPNTTVLQISANKDWKISLTFDSSDADWCSVTQESSDKSSHLLLTFKANKGINERKATLYISTRSEVHKLKITQKASDQIVATQSTYIIKKEGGDVEVKFDTNTEYNYQLDMNTALWLTFVSKEKKDNAVTMRFHADKNNGFGRNGILLLDPKNETINEVKIEIRQEPRQFESVEEINQLREGDLAVRLGSEIDNYSRIEALSLDGSLNSDDIVTLQKLFKTHSGYNQHLRNLDMFWCKINAPLANKIPAYMFANASYLETIKLPASTKIIGIGAFQHCTELKSIKIPDDVKVIEHNVFQNCIKLKAIDITENSMLQSIEEYAFNTGGEIESISLPYTLTKFDGTSFFGLKTKELHVKWETPPVLKKVGSKPNTTLYVPKNTAELYRNAAYWKDFGNIVEEAEK